MPSLLPHIDPDGLLEYSVVFTDRSLNSMSVSFQTVMTDISALLKDAYKAAAVAVIPGGGTFGMESIARQFANDQHVMIIRNGWFSYRWSEILEKGKIASSTTVMMARREDTGGSNQMAPFAPVPFVKQDGKSWEMVEHEADAEGDPFGRMAAFHGQMGMFTRALTYMMSHGSDGLKQVAEDAVLNANYILARLKHVMTPAYEGSCMHEALFSDRFLKDTGVSTLDFAKAMIDEGYHPMTMYFPLVVHGAMLIEPTETESKGGLDRFVEVLEALAEAAQAGESDRFLAAPVHAPTKRLDETKAARQPVLRWTQASDTAEAAE